MAVFLSSFAENRGRKAGDEHQFSASAFADRSRLWPTKAGGFRSATVERGWNV